MSIVLVTYSSYVTYSYTGYTGGWSATSSFNSPNVRNKITALKIDIPLELSYMADFEFYDLETHRITSDKKSPYYLRGIISSCSHDRIHGISHVHFSLDNESIDFIDTNNIKPNTDTSFEDQCLNAYRKIEAKKQKIIDAIKTLENTIKAIDYNQL